jgi:hypothetical protein
MLYSLFVMLLIPLCKGMIGMRGMRGVRGIRAISLFPRQTSLNFTPQYVHTTNTMCRRFRTSSSYSASKSDTHTSNWMDNLDNQADLTNSAKLKLISTTIQLITLTAQDVYKARTPSSTSSTSSTSSSTSTPSVSLAEMLTHLHQESSYHSKNAASLPSGSPSSVQAMKSLSEVTGLMMDFEIWNRAIEDAETGKKKGRGGNTSPD